MDKLESIVCKFKRKFPYGIYYFLDDTNSLLMKVIGIINYSDTDEIANLDNLIDEYLQIYPDEINKVNEKNYTALMFAVQLPENSNKSSLKIIDLLIKIIKILIKNGADLNIINSEGQTALVLAYNRYHVRNKIILEKCDEVIMLLIQNGANLNIKYQCYGNTMTAFDMYYTSHSNEIYLSPVFRLFVEKNVPIINPRCTDLPYHIENHKNYLKIQRLTQENDRLKLELKLAPDSLYVRETLSDHFYDLTK